MKSNRMKFNNEKYTQKKKKRNQMCNYKMQNDSQGSSVPREAWE